MLYDIVAATGAWKPPLYLPIYAEWLEPIRLMPLDILELGIHEGGSLKLWEAYFPESRISGVDLRLPAVEFGQRVRMFPGNQADCGFLTRVAQEAAPGGFDVIIDDCSHVGAMTKASFWHLFVNHLKPGALYFIEDWGTGYSPDWPDGREPSGEADSEQRMPSHDAGMVGFVKQLVDELHAHMVTPDRRISKFASMTLHPGLCIIRKVGNPISPVSLAPTGPLREFVGRLAGRARPG